MIPEGWQSFQLALDCILIRGVEPLPEQCGQIMPF